MTIRDETIPMFDLAARLVRLAHNLEHDLLVAQADAVAPGTGGDGGRGSDISDPTFRAIRTLAPFAKWERDIVTPIRAANRALEDAERAMLNVLAQLGQQLHGTNIDAEPRCPGWNEELQARLGGCGKHLETYPVVGADGKRHDQIRSTWLCVGCRRAKQRAEAEENAA